MAPVIPWLLVVSLLHGPAPTDTPTTSAWDRADASAAAGDHDTAVREYARAWAEHAAPAILYSWAQSERLRGHCTEAIALYERFVAQGSTPPASYDTDLLRAQWSNMLANAERQRDVCRETITATTEPPAPTPTPTPTPAATPEPTELGPPPPPERTTRWWRDAAGWSLAGTGAASLLAGVALVVVADQTDRRADEQPDHQRFDDAIDRAIVEQRVGFGLLGLGGALGIASIVRFAVVARRQSPRTRSMAFGVGPRGLVVRGRF